jgi:hypothetical protein
VRGSARERFSPGATLYGILGSHACKSGEPTIVARQHRDRGGQLPNDQLRPDLFQVVDLLAGIAQGQQLPD